MEVITFRLPADELTAVDSAVEQDDKLEDRSEFIRYAVRQQLQREETTDD